MIERDSAADAKLESAIHRALAGRHGVAAAWLFGSRATGRASPESDIDVAVLLGPELAHAPRLATLRAVVGALGDEVSTAALDVVMLDDHTPVALAWQVLAHGRRVVVNDAVAAHRFAVRVYREHGDREHVERFFRAVTKERARRAAGG